MAAESTTATLDGRWACMRARKRIVARVKLVVEWEESNRPRSINAFTMDVSHWGCLAVVGADLERTQTVRLLLKPDAGFWNL